MDAVCFAGFTEEELRQYRELEERIGNRILHHLQAETAKESLALLSVCSILKPHS